MRLKVEELSKYINVPFVFKWCEGRRAEGSGADDWYVKKTILYIKEIRNEFAHICNHTTNCKEGSLWIANGYGIRYYFDTLDDAADGITISNEGEKTCIRCDCPTEKRRDFLTFKVREFCPRCKF